MPATNIPFGDPKAQKKWAAKLAVETINASYFSKKFTGTSDNSIIQRKTELETEAGDRVSFDLSVMLRGRPTSGDNRVQGKEENLRFFTDEVVIDQLRKSVSTGGKMSRKRTSHNMRTIARERLTQYWAEYIDQMFFTYLSGSRGINEDYTEPTDYAGHANNPIQPPDAQHMMFGGSATSKATITTADKMSRIVIERAVAKARMMRALDVNAANMLPVTVEGEPHYIVVMTPFQEYDLRTSDAAGWLEVQKASAAAQGSKNPIFKGGLGMINNVVLHSHTNVIRFDDYGAGNDLPAARALFLGRQAGVLAFGTPSGFSFSWEEDTFDYKNEPSVMGGTIIGIKKTRFNDRDFGSIAIDTYSKNPEAA